MSYRYVCPRCRHSFETPEPRVVQPRCWYCAALMESGPRPMDREALRRSLLERAKSSEQDRDQARAARELDRKKRSDIAKRLRLPGEADE